MKDKNKSKNRLNEELQELRQQINKLKSGAIEQSSSIISDCNQVETELSKLFDLSSDLICVGAPDGKFTKINPSWERVLGYSTEEIMNLGWINLIHPDDISSTEREVKKQLAGNKTVNFINRYRCKDGTYRLLEWQATAIDDGQLYAIARDITHRKNAEQALEESEARFRKLFQKAPVGYQSLDEEGNLLEVNDTWCRTLGYTRDEVIGRNFIDFVDPSFSDIFERCFLTFKDVGSVDNIEHTMVKKDGSNIIASFIGRVAYNDDGSFKQTHCIFTDVTERKQVDEELKKSENKYRTLFEQSADAVLIIDEDQFVDCNIATVKMLGYKNKKELLETHPSQLSPEKQPDGKSSFVKANEMMTIALEKGSHRFEWDHKRQNGDIFPVEVLLTAIPFKDRKVLHVVWRDITETKRLQQLESRADRLETAGIIAGQVAHDFNNLLAPIVAYPDFIRDELPHDHKALPYLDDIERAARKIADINQELLTLSRRGYYNKEILNLNQIVLHAIKEIQPRTSDVIYETELCKDLMGIKGGNAQIHRILSNLLVNAVDAMQDIGRVTIKTENYYADDTSIAYGRVPKGEYVKLTVTDTGCGIPDEIVQKIIDPFFTTKTSDRIRGSGLGLSVVDSVMKDHGGYIDIISIIGQGASFFLYFPVSRDSIDSHSELMSKNIGTETVLVIDDDAIQREVSVAILKKLGYEVTTVESGEEAVEFLRENRRDLLILDMIMPGGIDGTETYRQVLEIDPKQKAIIVSGFAESDRAKEAQRLGAGAFIKKPLTKNAIAAAVRTELDRPARELA